MNEEKTLMPVGRTKDTTRYAIVPSGVGGGSFLDSVSSEYGEDSYQAFDEDETVSAIGIEIKGRQYKYVPFGTDNMLPFNVKNKIHSNMVTSQCQQFNVLACYGQGVRFVDRKTKQDIDDDEILDFCLRNSLHDCFMEQCTDMKYFFFSVTVIILNKKGNKIVTMRNKDACYCRFEYAPSTKSGKIEHVFFGDFRLGSLDGSRIEVIPLLDYWDPLGDLMVRMGRKRDPRDGAMHPMTKERKFAILCKVPTPGTQYYPIPYYMSIFRDAWYDIYRLIGIGKRFMIKNTSAPRTQIEVHNDYWDNVCDMEGITDESERVKRKNREKQDIINFVTGVENAGKAIVSGYYVDPNGKENRMVRIYPLNDVSKKEGGNWSDDMSEASNALCFAFGIHPNLVGATPGKSQMNNSGSDKRELFTLKQALEKPMHDVMCKPYHVVLHYNGWNKKATVDVPMIQLTTLDENKDSKKTTAGRTNTNDDDNNNN